MPKISRAYSNRIFIAVTNRRANNNAFARSRHKDQVYHRRVWVQHHQMPLRTSKVRKFLAREKIPAAAPFLQQFRASLFIFQFLASSTKKFFSTRILDAKRRFTTAQDTIPSSPFSRPRLSLSHQQISRRISQHCHFSVNCCVRVILQYPLRLHL